MYHITGLYCSNGFASCDNSRTPVISAHNNHSFHKPLFLLEKESISYVWHLFSVVSYAIWKYILYPFPWELSHSLTDWKYRNLKVSFHCAMHSVRQDKNLSFCGSCRCNGLCHPHCFLLHGVFLSVYGFCLQGMISHPLRYL